MKPKIDFSVIETYNIKRIDIIDDSAWYHLKDEKTYIEITLPSRTNSVLEEFKQGAINRFTAWNVGLANEENTDMPLPDGVYKVKVYVCDTEDKFSKTKYILRTIKLQKRIDEILMSIDMCCGKPTKTNIDMYNELFYLLQSAHANVRWGNIEQGLCEWRKAEELAEEYERCVKNKKCQ